MNTSTTRNNAGLPAQRASEVREQPSDAAGKGKKNAKDANAGTGPTSNPVKRGAAIARVPRGPFKIMTIPQAWYESLHATPPPVADAGKEQG